MGIVLHICFMLNGIMEGEETKEFEDLNDFRRLYKREIEVVSEEFKSIEEEYDIKVEDNEIAFIVKSIMETR